MLQPVKSTTVRDVESPLSNSIKAELCFRRIGAGDKYATAGHAMREWQLLGL